MTKFALTLLFILFIPVCHGQPFPPPYHLRTDLLIHTDAVSKSGIPDILSLKDAINQRETFQFTEIVSEKPTFSWEVDSTIGQITAYRVLVASSPELLEKDDGDYWDSKKVSSSRNRAEYQGKAIRPGKLVYWKVCTWNEKRVQTAFSQIVSFATAAPEPSEPFSHYPLAAEIQQPELVHLRNDGVHFLDFGEDALGQLMLNLTGLQDDTIWVEVGELTDKPYSIHANPGRNIRYLKIPLVLKKGTHDYVIRWPENTKRDSRNPILMPSYIGEVYPFRYVALHHYKGGIGTNSVRRKVVFYPFDDDASAFMSSDTILNQVWDLCKYSIKATSFSGYYVDGDRERIPYEADAFINQLSHYAVDAEYSMARRSVNYLLYHPTWPTEWSLQNVLIAWNDYMYTGDERLIRTYYPELQKKILIGLAGGNGLISTRTNKQTDDFLKSIHITSNFDGRRGLHDNVDWPQTGDFVGNEKEHKGETDGFVYNTYNAVINAYYYRNLILMQQMAVVLGRKLEAKFYEGKAKQVYNSFQTVFLDVKTGLIKDGDSTDHTSLHANMFALAFGLIPEKRRDRVVDFIKSRRMACSVYGAQFLLDALYETGQGQYALDLMTATTQRSWYNMIRVGSTITMEAWDKVYKPNLDLNHAWGAAPANIIVRQLMGIQPEKPGFEHFQIKPQLGKLTSVSIKAPTIKGAIIVKYDKTSARDKMEVIIPGGTKVNVFMPQSPGKSHLLVDGKSLFVQSEKGFFVAKNLGSGKHVLTLD